MHADVLIAEIGSTTTLVSAFRLSSNPRVFWVRGRRRRRCWKATCEAG